MPDNPRILDYEPVINPQAKQSGKDRSSPADESTRSDQFRKNAGEHITAAAKPRAKSENYPRPQFAQQTSLTDNWIVKRGHAISYAGLFVFTIVLYFRPQEYISALAKAPIAIVPAILMLLAFIPTQLGMEGTLTVRPREVNLALLLCLLSALSIPLAIDPYQGWSMFADTCLKDIVLFIVIVNVVRTERRLRILLYLVLIATFIICVQSINDYRQGKLAVEGYRISGNSTGGMFENPNDLAVQLVIMLPIAVALFLSTRNVIKKMLFAVSAISSLMTIVLTYSRGAFLGLLASSIVMAWKLGRHNRFLVFGIFLVIVILFLTLAPGQYWTRVFSIFDARLDAFGSSNARSELLKQSFLVALRHPLFGIGIGNFPLVSTRAQVTHNSYTQVAAEIGFAAAVIYTMFIVAPLKRLRQIESDTATRSTREASRFYYLSVGLQASLVAYMIGSYFTAVAFYLYIYYLVGYAICLRRIYQASEAKGTVTQSSEEERKPGLVADHAPLPSNAERHM